MVLSVTESRLYYSPYLFFLITTATTYIGLNESNWGLTKESALKIGREIKEYEIGDIYDINNPSKLSPSNCPDKEINNEGWLSCLHEYYMHNPVMDRENEIRKNYIELEIQKISESKLIKIADAAYKEEYKSFKDNLRTKLLKQSDNFEASEDILRRRMLLINNLEGFGNRGQELYIKILVYIAVLLIDILIFWLTKNTFFYITTGKFIQRNYLKK